MEALISSNTSNTSFGNRSLEMSEVKTETGGWGSFARSDFVIVLYSIICVVGITGNFLVTFVLLRVPTLRSNTSDFLIHLSLVDFIVCVLVIPNFLVVVETAPSPNPGVFSELWCRFFNGKFLFWVCALTSVFSLVTVNLERFVAIVYPLKYKVVFTRRNKILMITTCWILATLSKTFILFLYDEGENVGCRFLGWPNPEVQAVVGLYTFIVQLPGPFLVMVWAQWRVISTLKRQMKVLKGRMASSTVNPADQRKMWQLRASQTLIRTLLTFVITFAVCWAPIQVMFLVYNFGVYVDFSSPFRHISVMLSVCNSCVNPILYTLMNKPFRKGIREALCKRRNSVNDGGGTSSNRHPGTMTMETAMTTKDT
ncbi:somatostatin receptor type 4-like [Asterias amurensis]|uniref:somatostatin receptor type 4-like n=1 Tax=Asterias amurensis TaxID=7602 RepID=UPI003AB7F758